MSTIFPEKLINYTKTNFFRSYMYQNFNPKIVDTLMWNSEYLYCFRNVKTKNQQRCVPFVQQKSETCELDKHTCLRLCSAHAFSRNSSSEKNSRPINHRRISPVKHSHIRPNVQTCVHQICNQHRPSLGKFTSQRTCPLVQFNTTNTTRHKITDKDPNRSI